MAGCSVVVLLYFWKRSKKLFAYALAGVPIVLAGISMFLWLVSPMVRERVNGMLHPEEDGAAVGRLVMWSDTLEMIKDQPVWGHGPGVFRWIYPSYKTILAQLWARYAHNEYLHLWAEYGVPGIVLLFLALGAGVFFLAREFLRADSEKVYMLYAGSLGIIVAACVHATFDYTFHIMSCVHAALFFIGLSMGVGGSGGSIKMHPVSKTMLSARAVLAVMLVGLMVMNARMYASDYFSRVADADRESLALDDAVGTYKRAISFDGRYWKPMMGIGHVYKTRTFWEWDENMKASYATNALAWYERALDYNPYEVEAVLGESKVYSTLGNYDKAFEKFEWLVEFAPRDQHFLLQYGMALRSAGFYKEALEIFREAWKAAPGNENTKMINLNISWLTKKVRSETKKP
jgi:tetratricopeptide (TPR) repeat protein